MSTAHRPNRLADRPGLRTGVGVFAIVATYVLFLLWDQFGFLRHPEAATDSGGIRYAMAAMGVAGLATSLLTGRLLARVCEDRMLAAGFLLAAVFVPASRYVDSGAALAAAGAALGVATGVVTVSLAAGLRRWLPGPDFAIAAGLGTGLAYWVCNVPWLFEGSAAVQAATVSLFCLVAAVGVSLFPGRDAEQSGQDASAPRRRDAEQSGQDARAPRMPGCHPLDPRGRRASRPLSGSFLSLLLAFLALVWLDSAAFAVIQETLTLKGATWATPSQKWLQGGSHLLAALAAGLLLRRGTLRGLLLATFVLFGVAFQLLQTGTAAWVLAAGPIYAFGISLYSTALVVAPSLGDGSAALPRRWRAALLYGIAGWLGSALGVGMAQDLHRIPGLFVAAAGTVLVLGWAAATTQAREFLRLHAVTALGVAAAVVVFLVVPAARPVAGPEPASSHEASAARGRRVYIAEGCMSCHSQYVRPRHQRDLDLYGPHHPLDRDDAPPLIGLRRQGPDLSNVGARHDDAWLRRHLQDPRADVHASVMPSYRRLFRDGDSRGDDLVAYLHDLRPATAEPQ